MPTLEVFFTLNGKFLKSVCRAYINNLYCSFGFWDDCEVEYNFGNKEWMYNLEEFPIDLDLFGYSKKLRYVGDVNSAIGIKKILSMVVKNIRNMSIM
jgi:hypothetical protein